MCLKSKYLLHVLGLNPFHLDRSYTILLWLKLDNFTHHKEVSGQDMS